MERVIELLEERIAHLDKLSERHSVKEDKATWIRKNECIKLLEKIKKLSEKEPPEEVILPPKDDLFNMWLNIKEQDFEQYCSGKSTEVLEKTRIKIKEILKIDIDKQIRAAARLYLKILDEKLEVTIKK